MDHIVWKSIHISNSPSVKIKIRRKNARKLNKKKKRNKLIDLTMKSTAEGKKKKKISR